MGAHSKDIRALKTRPETVSPARHSWLWRLSKVVRNWEQRWFCLDRQGFVYSKSPQGIALAKPVFGREMDVVAGAEVEEKTGSKDGVMMWGFTVRSSSRQSVTLYSEDPALRDQWVGTLNSWVTAQERPQYINDRFSINFDQPLGTGLFAVCLRALELTTEASVAIKVIKANAFQEYQDLVEREIMVWHAVGSHPHVVKLLEVLYSERRVYFVAELAAGGNLMDSLAQVSSYTEADVARITVQLLEAVRHLHTVGIVHMDLKPENIVLADRSPDSSIKLIDFSLASFFNTSTEPGGTPEFVAPELLDTPELFAERGCGPSIDIWAVGIIVYHLLSGRTPFQAENQKEIVNRVKQGVWTFQPPSTWATVSHEAKDLIFQCLQRDPTRRPTAAHLLGHPWFQTVSVQHANTQLSAALQEFKVLYAQPESKQALRRSMVRRSGVWGHEADNLFAASSGAAESAQQPPSSLPPPAMSLNTPYSGAQGFGMHGGMVAAVMQSPSLQSLATCPSAGSAGSSMGQASLVPQTVGVPSTAAAIAQMQAEIQQLQRLKLMRELEGRERASCGPGAVDPLATAGAAQRMPPQKASSAVCLSSAQVLAQRPLPSPPLSQQPTAPVPTPATTLQQSVSTCSAPPATADLATEDKDLATSVSEPDRSSEAYWMRNLLASAKPASGSPRQSPRPSHAARDGSVGGPADASHAPAGPGALTHAERDSATGSQRASWASSKQRDSFKGRTLVASHAVALGSSEGGIAPTTTTAAAPAAGSAGAPETKCKAQQLDALQAQLQQLMELKAARAAAQATLQAARPP